MAWRWYNAPAGDIRLLSRDYVEAVQKWISQLPEATRKQLPDDFLSKHMEDRTEPFRNVRVLALANWQPDRRDLTRSLQISRYCDKWQERYFSSTDGVKRRREAAYVVYCFRPSGTCSIYSRRIIRKIRVHDATWRAPSQLFEDPRWKQLVNRVHPFSERGSFWTS